MGTFVPTFKLALINAAFGDGKSVSKHLAPIHPIAPADSTQVEIWRGVTYAYAGQADSTAKYADKLSTRASSNCRGRPGRAFARGQLYLTMRQCGKALNPDEFRQSDSTWELKLRPATPTARCRRVTVWRHCGIATSSSSATSISMIGRNPRTSAHVAAA